MHVRRRAVVLVTGTITTTARAVPLFVVGVATVKGRTRTVIMKVLAAQQWKEEA